MTSSAEAGARDVPQKRGKEAAEYTDDVNMLLAELLGGSLHEGYWESASDHSTMAEASVRLTELMAEKIMVGPGDRVLDIGCGIGTPAIQLARLTGAAVVGITNSPAQVQRAEQNAQDAGMSEQVTFECEDALELPFPAKSFDAVMMIESIFDMPDRLAVLRQAASVLRPGGRLALTDLLDRTTAPVTMRRAAEELDEHASSHGHPRTIALPIRLESYESLLEQAGLIPTEMTDISEHTVARTFVSIRQRLADDHEHLVQKFGSQLVDQYETVLPLLEAARIGYGIVVATAPGQ